MRLPKPQFLCICFLLTGLYVQAQTVLTVQTDSLTKTYTRAELAAMPRTTVEADDHGKTHRYEGIALSELLRPMGIPQGQALRGKWLTYYLNATAADGYQAIFALPELDPAFTNRTLILADTEDGKPLGEAAGPYRIVVPGEKRGARWVRQVIRIAVRKAQ